MPITIKRATDHSHFPVTVNKSENGLQTKASVGYVYAPGTSILCGECAFVGVDGLCTDHPGLEQQVDLLSGSCNDWQNASQGPVTGNNSRPWIEVAYITNTNGFGCRRCEHMSLEKHDCNAVDKDSPGATPGRIDPYGCCTLWTPHTRRGNWPESRFKDV